MGLVMVVSAISGFLIITRLVFDRFNEIESSISLQTTNDILKQINKGFDTINLTSSDWGCWDETYNFAQNQNQEYIDSNLYTNEFLVLKVNAIAIYNKNNHKVYLRTYDYKKDTQLATDNELVDMTDILVNSLKFKNIDDIINGYFGKNNMYYFAAHQTSPSICDDESKVNGTILFIRQINAQDPQDFALNSPPNVILNTANFNTLDPAVKMGIDTSKVTSIKTTSSNIYTYSIIPDIFGNPLIYLTVNSERVFTNESITLNSSIFIMMLLLLLVFSIIFYLIIDRSFFQKFKQIYNFLEHIKTQPDTDERFTAGLGKDFDEIKDVLNSLLDKLKLKQTQLEQVNEKLLTQNQELLKSHDIFNEKNKELSKINQLMVGREIKMIELKEELKKHDLDSPESTIPETRDKTQ